MPPVVFGALLAGLLGLHGGAPWRYSNDDNGAWFSSVAWAHLARGLSATRGQDFFLSRASGELEPYLHHPPMPGLLLAAVFRATGHDSPRVARGTFAALHLATFALLAWLAARRAGWGRPAGAMGRANAAGPSVAMFVATLAVAATVPMSAFYGKMPNHEVPGLLFFLAGVVCWGDGEASPTWRRLAGAWGCWFLAVFSAWHAAFCIVGWLAVQMRRPTRRRAMVSLAVVAAMLGLVAMHLLWAGGWRMHASQGAAVARWRWGGETPLASALGAYRHALGIGVARYAYLPAILACGWLLASVGRAIRRTASPVRAPALPVVALAVGSLAYFVCFPEALSHHAYQGFYLIPFVALASGDVVGALAATPARRMRAASALLVAILCLCGILTTAHMYRKPSQAAVHAAAAIEARYR